MLRRFEWAKRNFQRSRPYGNYLLTAFPPEGTSLLAVHRAAVGADQDQHRRQRGQHNHARPASSACRPSIGGQDGGVPIVYSGSPAPMTVAHVMGPGWSLSGARILRLEKASRFVQLP